MPAATRSERVLLLVVVLALLTDIGTAFLTLHNEWEGSKRAIPTEAQIVKLRRRQWGDKDDPSYRYEVTYQYASPDGKQHSGLFLMTASDGKMHFGPNLSSEVERSIIEDEKPGALLTVFYDPEWPARSWLNREWLRDSDWTTIQLVICVFQLAVLLPFTGSSRRSALADVKPSLWTGLFPVMPFVAETIGLFLLGLTPEFGGAIMLIQQLP